MKFKFNDKVLCQGQITTIRDIYTRVVKSEDESYTTQITYRLQDKPFWYTEFTEDQLTLLVES
jgi:tartrate dehydratase beta subunit/fumarate hydratase class I family protein